MKNIRKIKSNSKGIEMISTNKAIAGIVLITLLNGFVSVNMFKNQTRKRNSNNCETRM